MVDEMGKIPWKIKLMKMTQGKIKYVNVPIENV